MGQNILIHETSPYLLQHKNNPVWWRPWGKEAFDGAKKENKPIFLSIGYSTCHWCHVMEKDSFEKQDVADILNKNFISIKVDREERPDVDAIYMNAVQALSGRGGWPLSALLLPDGTPFWGGTFLPHDNFIELLIRVNEVWKENPQELKNNSKTMMKFLTDGADLPSPEKEDFSTRPLIKFRDNFSHRFDEIHGGLKGSPKFPPALACSLLLRIFRRTGEEQILHKVEKTLSEMRRGGLYDQIGGGFHRYSVDEQWLIPHFEKMLYDNALLSLCYLEGYQVTHKSEYAQTAKEILDYILRDMTSNEGGFYSAEDADSENIEGKFYVWTEEELSQTLNEVELNLIKKTFNITAQGNFHTHKTGDEVNPHLQLEPPTLTGHVFYLKSSQTLPHGKHARAVIEKLFEKRKNRIRPHLDDKILLSWNGLMITSLARGFQILEDPRYLKAAQRAAHFILEKFWLENKKLARVFRKGKINITALADDYAFFIEGLLHLYQTDFNQEWFISALKLQEKQNELFWDEKKGSFFDSDGEDPNLIIRNKNFEDGVIPSANSVSAHNLLKLSRLTGNLDYKIQAQAILRSASLLIDQYPQAAAKILQVLDDLTSEGFEVALISPVKLEQTSEILRNLRQIFLPQHIFAAQFSDIKGNKVPLLDHRILKDSHPTFYLCHNHSCLAPLTEFKDVLEKLKKFSPL